MIIRGSDFRPRQPRQPSPADYRIQIGDGGRIEVVAAAHADPGIDLDALAVLHDDVRTRRCFEFVMVDEGPPRARPDDYTPPPGIDTLIGAQAQLRLAGFTYEQELPITITQRCGMTTRVELRAPGATGGVARGHHLVATATLDATFIGTIVWRAVRAGILAAVCPLIADKVVNDSGELWIGGAFFEVQLLPVGRPCLDTTRILRTWTEPRA